MADENKQTESKRRKKKQKKKPLTPQEQSRIIWLNARNSHRHQVEKSRPSWITSDDMIDAVNYIDPDDNFNPYRGW